MKPMRIVIALVLASIGVIPALAQTRDDQNHLGPGLYVFQTRITEASCGDADRTGYVNSYFASIEGIPGANDAVMRLIDSQFWPRWGLSIAADGMVSGSARNERVQGTNQFHVRWNGSRYTGTGTRTYRNGNRTCNVTFDALLRRIDI